MTAIRIIDDHIELANIGSNTHAQIDTGLTKLAGIESGATADQTKADIDGLGLSHDSLVDVSVNDHHNELHSIVSHNDTTATGTQLDTLTDNSIADTLHRHSELVASDGSPDPALTVDADGIIHLPSQSSCGVKLTSDQTITTGTWTKLTFGTVQWDNQNEYDETTNHRFTPKTAGKYLCCGIGRVEALADGKIFAVLFEKNGTAFGGNNMVVMGGAGAVALNVSCIIDLSVGDYIELFIYHTHGSDRTALSRDYFNTMQIVKIA